MEVVFNMACLEVQKRKNYSISFLSVRENKATKYFDMIVRITVLHLFKNCILFI